MRMGCPRWDEYACMKRRTRACFPSIVQQDGSRLHAKKWALLPRTKPASTLILDFQPLELWPKNQHLLFKPPSLWYCYSSLGWLTHSHCSFLNLYGDYLMNVMLHQVTWGLRCSEVSRMPVIEVNRKPDSGSWIQYLSKNQKSWWTVVGSVSL